MTNTMTPKQFFEYLKAAGYNPPPADQVLSEKIIIPADDPFFSQENGGHIRKKLMILQLRGIIFPHGVECKQKWLAELFRDVERLCSSTGGYVTEIVFVE